MQPQKNLLNGIAGLAGVSGRRWCLDLVGDGPQRGEIEATCKEIGLDSQVRFHGWVDTPRVFQIMENADIMFLPSHSEGLSLASLEGLRAGLAFLASRIPGVEGVIEDNVNGTLCDPGRPLEFGAGLKRMIDDPAILMRMQAESRQRANAFDSERMIGGYERELRRIALSPPQTQLRGAGRLSWISPRVIRGNRGDIASRYCILSELIAAGVDVNAVFATRPEHVPSALRGRLVSYGPIYNLWPRLEGLRAFFRSRYVVWTGGLDLQDDSSLVKLVHMWIVFASYRALGLRIVLAMQGAGPLTTPTGRWLARRVLALVDAALLRDRGSFELVAGLTKQEKLVLAHDGIFLSGLSANGEDDLEQRPSR